jgi:hypothetical protein
MLMGSDDGAARWIEPVVSGPLAEPDGRVHTQVMLHDVTLQQERPRASSGMHGVRSRRARRSDAESAASSTTAPSRR